MRRTDGAHQERLIIVMVSRVSHLPYITPSMDRNTIGMLGPRREPAMPRDHRRFDAKLETGSASQIALPCTEGAHIATIPDVGKGEKRKHTTAYICVVYTQRRSPLEGVPVTRVEHQ